MDVEPYEKKTFTVTSLKYVGENENFVYKQDSPLTFTVAGIPADVQALSVTRFSPTVDVTDL